MEENNQEVVEEEEIIERIDNQSIMLGKDGDYEDHSYNSNNEYPWNEFQVTVDKDPETQT